MINRSFFTTGKHNKVEDYRVEILCQQLEEQDDWNGEINDKADHPNDISILSKLLSKGISIINIIARSIDNQQAGIERENEGYKGQYDA